MSPALRVGIIDASYDSMPQILHEVQAANPDLVMHQVEASVPWQYQHLADGRLDVGIGRAVHAPPEVASELFRQDLLGVLVPSGHRFTALNGVPVAALADEPLLLAEDLTEPACWYPWSILWRAADESEHVRAVVTCARQMSQRLGWMAVAARVAG